MQIKVKKGLYNGYNTAHLSSSAEGCLNERQMKESSAKERSQEQLFSVCSQNLFFLEHINLPLHYVKHGGKYNYTVKKVNSLKWLSYKKMSLIFLEYHLFNYFYLEIKKDLSS